MPSGNNRLKRAIYLDKYFNGTGLDRHLERKRKRKSLKKKLRKSKLHGRYSD